MSEQQIEVSVILTAFNRKDYVKFAIDSLSEQTLDSSKFEVLYFSNFPDYDNYCLSKIKNVKIFHPETSKWGEWLYIAVRHAAGNIITMLDDDDLYDKSRLERLYKVFKEVNNSGCIFYVNNFILFDGENTVQRARDSEPRVYFIGKPNVFVFRKLLKRKTFYNNSRLAFSRSLLINNIDVIKQIDSAIFDTFMASLAYENNCQIIVDDAPLTYVRNTPNSLSKPSLNYLIRAHNMGELILTEVAKSDVIKAYIKYGELYTNYLMRKLHKSPCKRIKLTFNDVILLTIIKDVKALYLMLYNWLFC